MCPSSLSIPLNSTVEVITSPKITFRTDKPLEVLLQREMNMEEGETLLTLQPRLANLGASCVVETLQDFFALKYHHRSHSLPHSQGPHLVCNLAFLATSRRPQRSIPLDSMFVGMSLPLVRSLIRCSFGLTRRRNIWIVEGAADQTVHPSHQCYAHIGQS